MDRYHKTDRPAGRRKRAHREEREGERENEREEEGEGGE